MILTYEQRSRLDAAGVLRPLEDAYAVTTEQDQVDALARLANAVDDALARASEWRAA